jgi:hypothetical protein
MRYGGASSALFKEEQQMKLGKLAILIAALSAPGVHAGDFTPLGSSPLIVDGSDAQAGDPFFLARTAFTTGSFDGHSNVVTSISYRAFEPDVFGETEGALIANGILTTIGFRFTANIELADDGSLEQVGHLYDYVFRDSRDNTLVFGTRVKLGAESYHDDEGELNNIFRSGYAGYETSVAWIRLLDGGNLRPFNAGLTPTGLDEGDAVYDPNVVGFQSDINLSEGNPNSGLYLIKTNATHFSVAAGAVTLFQAGEEGQSIYRAIYDGFAPAALVPEPETYAMLLAGLGLIGLAARRRTKV